MQLSEEKRTFFMKCFIIATSVVVAALIAQMIMAILVVVLYYVPLTSSLPNIASAIVFVVGISLALFLGFVSFKKIYRYLDREIGGKIE